MMKRLLFTLMISAALLSAQDAPETQPEAAPAPAPQSTIPEDAPVKVIPLKNSNAQNVVDGLFPLFRNQAEMSAIRNTNTVVLRAPAEVINIIESAIQEMDKERERPATRPQRNVELTMFLLMGHAEGITDESIPDALNPTIEQLKKVLPYKGYTLMDSMLQRGMDYEKVVVSSVAESEPGAEQPTIIELELVPQVNVGSNPARITLHNLSLGARIPIVTGKVDTEGKTSTQFQYINVGIDTNLDVQEGQYTVVGKTGIGPDRSIVLVILAKVVD